MTINLVKLEEENKGYVVVSEIANDILVAVNERKKFYIKNSFFSSRSLF